MKDYLGILVGLIAISFFFASCMSVEVHCQVQSQYQSSVKIDHE